MKSYLYLKPLLLWKDPFYWFPIFHIDSDWLKSIFPALVKAGIIGLLVAMAGLSKHRKDSLLITCVLVYFTLLYSMYFVMDRYNEPLMPLIFLGMALGARVVLRW
ncbi:hypothetical protein [Effusibacillus dendaii]|uniref:Glycosyltransferase RgtA/B/C/D-like domain-containing protein n=1 Tax=Effusibacillus dendaii TaxID=2743772 RepID=A0A7I8D7Q8_9BACL|nr:hypothetical protein [Effusibacillus dendaii]BCJ85039.1 hypothetical protein skT53_00240 [Effusibacillus dendaii]